MSADASKATVSRQNLLIVDDEQAQLLTLRDIFTEEGFEVCTCGKFEEAIDRCRELSFAVAILDIRLGGGDGIELLDRLRQAQPGIRTIIHTGYGSFDSAKDAVNLGAFAYVEKRGGPSELISQVHRAVKDFLSEALTRSERRYRSLVEGAPVCIHEIGLDGKLTSINPAGLWMVGAVDEASVVGRDYLSFVAEDDRARIESLLKRAYGGEGSSFEFRCFVHGEPRLFSSNLAPIFGEHGAVERVMGTTEDVTDRRAAEAELRASEERFRQLAENVNAVVWMRSADGRKQLYVSPRYEEIWGRRLDSLKENSESFLDAVIQKDRPRVRQAVESLINGGKAEEYDVEYRIERGEGEIRWIRDRGFSIRDDEGDIIRQAGFAEDVTESRHAFEQMRIRGRAIAAANMGVVISDATTTDQPIIYCNPAFERLTGYSKEDVVGRNCRLLQSDDRDQDGMCAMREAVAEGRSCVAVIRNYRKDGRMFWNESSIYPVHDKNGRLTHFVGFMNDITDRLEAEEVLRNSERSLALAQRIAHMGSWELDLSTGQPTGSAEMFRLLGLPETESPPSMDSFVSEFVDPDDMEAIARSYHRASTSGVTEALEFRFRRRPDHLVRFARAEAEVISGQDGSPQKIIGTFQDITEQKQVESALRESEDKFRSLTEKSPAIVLIAREDRLVYCNPMLSVVTGYSNEELLRMRLQDVVHPEYRELTADRHRRRLKGEEVPQRYEGKIVTKSGEDRWVDVSAQLVEFEGVPAVLVTCVNVTERKLAEDALRHSEETLRQVNESLEQRVAERTADLNETNAELAAFAHSVSHDLRAPLRAMEGFAAALAEDYGQQINEGGHEFIQHIVDSARRMDVLINDLLTYSRLGRTEIRANSVGLNSVTKEALFQLGSEIKARNAEVHVAESMATVLGHRATLLQVVTNLLSNAMKFVADGVRPEIRVWSERRDDGMIRLWCEDNGIGIDGASQDRIFRVFERLHGIESYPGTGIGLAIVARACDRLGGRCGFESQLGRGSRFWVELPVGDQ